MLNKILTNKEIAPDGYILPLAKFEQYVIIVSIEIVDVSLEAAIHVIY